MYSNCATAINFSAQLSVQEQKHSSRGVLMALRYADSWGTWSLCWFGTFGGHYGHGRRWKYRVVCIRKRVRLSWGVRTLTCIHKDTHRLFWEHKLQQRFKCCSLTHTWRQFCSQLPPPPFFSLNILSGNVKPCIVSGKPFFGWMHFFTYWLIKCAK